MTNHSLPYFGEINLTALEEYYNVEANINGDKVRFDINFKSKVVDEVTFQSIKAFLQSIDKFNKGNRSLIENDYQESGETADYINFYFDEFDPGEISNIIGIEDINTPKEKQLLNKLRLVRVGLYPDGKYGASYFGVFDYTIDIDGEPCNQLLVVKTNEKGELDHITWES